VSTSGFVPGKYLLVLPQKVRNVCTVVCIDYIMSTSTAHDIATYQYRVSIGTLKDFIAKFRGWVVLEKKDAGPNEIEYMRLKAQNGELVGAHGSYRGPSFNTREEFFRALKDSLAGFLKIKEILARG
jgi:hypothetical protein